MSRPSASESIEARALWTVGPRETEIRDERLMPPGTGEVLVSALCSGISRGTESLVFNARVPTTEYDTMRAPHQSGAFPYPVKYGYCSVGRVEAGPPALTGHVVFALHPHQDRYVVPVEHVTVLPSDVPPKRAVLAANMETAINALWDAELKVGDRVCVIGAGVVGCLVAYLAARVPGCDVELCDLDPRKEAIARQLGVRWVLPEHATKGCDRVFEASGSGNALRSALTLCGPEATLVALSWYGAGEISLPLGGSFHAQRTRIVSSQVGQIAGHQRPRWTYARRLGLALRTLADPTLDHLLTGTTIFDQLPDEMAEILEPSRFVLCHRVVYS